MTSSQRLLRIAVDEATGEVLEMAAEAVTATEEEVVGARLRVEWKLTKRLGGPIDLPADSEKRTQFEKYESDRRTLHLCDIVVILIIILNSLFWWIILNLFFSQRPTERGRARSFNSFRRRYRPVENVDMMDDDEAMSDGEIPTLSSARVRWRKTTVVTALLDEVWRERRDDWWWLWIFSGSWWWRADVDNNSVLVGF